MFTPIKNFITYIQKNASGNSIFGGGISEIERSAKMETENINTETVKEDDMETGSEIPKEIDKEEDYVDKNVEENVCEGTENFSSNFKNEDADTKTTTTSSLAMPTAVATENACEFEDEDFEAQIESSIMLKRPVKVAATNCSEILEVKKSLNASASIVISHDCNRSQPLCPRDDELEDFRHDPMEAIRTTSSEPCSKQHFDEVCSVESAEEAFERDFKSKNNFQIKDDEEYHKTEEYEQKGTNNSFMEVEDEKDIETENDQNGVTDVEDEEEPFLDLDSFKNSKVIVMDEVDLNASSASVDTNNTADDPLAIACEEQEAFSADKTAALEELNLQNSQDEDTQTTIDEDLRWLKPDLEDNQPTCSSKVLPKDKPSTEEVPEKEERNGEGSDSGLGSETSALHITTTSITDSSQLNTTSAIPAHTPTQVTTKSPPNDPPKPYRSNLKRRLEVNDVVEGLSSLTSTAASLNEYSSLDASVQKKPKRSINFDTVQVYYFPRQQGFSCVPSAGGCTLGMGARHVAVKTLSLAEHVAELRRAHRMQLQEINPRGSSSDDSEESEEDYLSEGSGSDLDGESNGFLQPVSPKQRRALLKAAGIRKIDTSEKAECRNIRNSREICGCTCRNFCDPETCACSQSGIKCQVDRDMFPCGCSQDACGNTIGRVEFNPNRVRTHYIHTLMRLEMENRQQQSPYSSAVVSSPMHPTPSSYYQAHLQPQSNYSSGYASPAYNTAPEIHQQTAASSYYHTHNPSTTSTAMYGQQTTLEMTHNATATTSHYGIDSLDTSLFGGTAATAPSYGELMPVQSYHYGNVQTHAQASSYNSYHNTPYINTNSSNTSSLSPSNTFSSCAVPSIPPFGTATTTEASGVVYHSVSSLTSLETTTALSCSGTTSLENDASSSFISLSTPLASSSRLSQINDLLQHNRNATTALVAVEDADNKLDTATCLTLEVNDNNLPTTGSSSSLCSSVNVPHIDEASKSCMVFEELVAPLKPTTVVTVSEDEIKSGPAETIIPTLPPAATAAVAETLTKSVEDPSSSLFSTEFLPQSSSSDDDINDTTNAVAVSANVESPSAIEVAAGN